MVWFLTCKLITTIYIIKPTLNVSDVYCDGRLVFILILKWQWPCTTAGCTPFLLQQSVKEFEIQDIRIMWLCCYRSVSVLMILWQTQMAFESTQRLYMSKNYIIIDIVAPMYINYRCSNAMIFMYQLLNTFYFVY